MYLIRRVIKVKTGATVKAAHVLAKIGSIYEKTGQRGPSRVYWSGTSVPGEKLLYIDWTQESIDSVFRDGLQHPGDLFAELDGYQEVSTPGDPAGDLEIYEMYELK